MTDEAATTQQARQHAAERLKLATAELSKAADRIAERFEIPDNINGLSRGEFLGRVSFVVSLERDLRRAGEDVYAQHFIRSKLAGIQAPAIQAPAIDSLDDVPPAESAPEDPARINDAMPIENIPGLTVQIVKALKQAGIHQLGDVNKFTDDALLKINGIANPSLQKLRASVAAVGG